MPKMRHPLSGALYSLRDDGLIEVEEDGVTGLFHPDGRHAEGPLRHADMHLLQWLGGPKPDAGGADHSPRHQGLRRMASAS